jgi:hypothetical protein
MRTGHGRERTQKALGARVWKMVMMLDEGEES